MMRIRTIACFLILSATLVPAQEPSRDALAHVAFFKSLYHAVSNDSPGAPRALTAITGQYAMTAGDVALLLKHTEQFRGVVTRGQSQVALLYAAAGSRNGAFTDLEATQLRGLASELHTSIEQLGLSFLQAASPTASKRVKDSIQETQITGRQKR